MLDIFNNDAFKLTPLTATVNEQPHVPSRLRSMGLFTFDGISSTTMAIESIKGSLKLVPSTPRGGPGHQHTPDKRKMRDFRLAHIQLNDHVAADEVQGVRELGQENQLRSLISEVNSRFLSMSQDIDVTEEHLMMGALKGQVIDGDGSTVLWDLFSEFGVSALSDVDFTLGTSTTNIKALCNQVIRGMINELGDTPLGMVHAMCGDDFYDGLSTHAEVRDSYHRQQESAFLREGAGSYETFKYGNITWENYRGSVGGTPFVANDECRFFVRGVPGLFVGRYGPADYNETVNTRGLPRYAKLIPDQNDKGAALEEQTNLITLCTRPRTLRKGLTSN